MVNVAKTEGVRRAARLCAALALALAVTSCGGRETATVEPAPSATPVAATATPARTETPDTGTTLESPLGTTFESPPGTTLESPLATPTPAVQSQDRAAMEEAVAAVMLDVIVRQDLAATPSSAGEVAAADVKPEDDLIVWAPAQRAVAAGDNPTAFDRLPKLDDTAPIRVWVHRADGQAVVTGDAAALAAAIRAYRAATIEADATQDVQTWGLYEFGIVALDEAAGQATVYFAASCGRLCGSGTLYTLGRGPDGAWTVIGETAMWMA